MGTTANYDLPYPELGDASNVPQDIRSLAEATDTALAADDVTPVDGSGSVTAAANYTITNVSLFKVGSVVHFSITTARTSDPGASSYITFATLPVGFRPAGTIPLNAGVQSVTTTWTPKAQVTSAGLAQISMSPTGGSGNGMNVTGTWLAA